MLVRLELKIGVWDFEEIREKVGERQKREGYPLLKRKEGIGKKKRETVWKNTRNPKAYW